MESGRSLTGEILQRLEASFPPLPDRVAALEAEMAKQRAQVAALLSRVEELERRAPKDER